MKLTVKLCFVVGQRRNGAIEVQSVKRYKDKRTMSLDFNGESPESFVILKTVEIPAIDGESMTSAKTRAAILFGKAQLSGKNDEPWVAINDLVSAVLDDIDFGSNDPLQAKLIEQVAAECEAMKDEIPRYQRIRCVRYNDSNRFEWLAHGDEIPKHAAIYPTPDPQEILDEQIELGFTA